MAGENYATIQKILHWAIAVAAIGMLATGFYMSSIGFSADLPQETQDLRNQLYSMHKSTGFLVLALMILRLLLRLVLGAPPLPRSVPQAQRFAAQASHFTLYALLIAMPLAGWAAVSVGGFMEPVYGLFEMPPLLEKGTTEEYFDVIGVHVAIAFAILAVLAAHVAGALYHLLIRRDGVFRRMWF